MRKLKQLRGLIIAFVTGLALSNLSTGIKLCIAVSLILTQLVFLEWDFHYQHCIRNEVSYMADRVDLKKLELGFKRALEFTIQTENLQ